MPTFLRTLLTGRDNFSWDVARVLMFMGGLVFLGCTLISVCKTLQFDMDKFGYGLGALLGGGGAGIGAKAHAEPDASPAAYITPPDAAATGDAGDKTS